MREFGFNYTNFAEPRDFLIAGLREPTYLYITIAGIAAFVMLVIGAQRSGKSRNDKKWLIASYFSVTLFFSAQIPIEAITHTLKVRKGADLLRIQFKNGRTPITKGSLITTTSQYLFIYDHDDDLTKAITSSSIISLEQTKKNW